MATFLTLFVIVYGLLVADHALGRRLHNQRATTGKFWHYTDPHADYSYLTEGYSCGEVVPNRSPIGNYHCDPPWSLVRSSINVMKQIEPNVDFVIWTGDNVMHTEQAKEEDVLSTAINLQINYIVTDMLKTTFGHIPVYPSVGNHDYFLDAQFPPTPDPFYHYLQPRWYSWIREPHFNTTFSKGGYYAINLSRNLKLISLNTILSFTNNKKVENITDPADQFFWFESQLIDARISGRKVYVIAHIGMGFPYAVTWRWFYDTHHARYLDLMERYKDVIVAMFFGHDHTDSFKVFHDSTGEPRFPLFFAPSVTPWMYDLPRNPAIRLVQYDKQTGRILEMSQYFLDLPKAISTGVLRWEKLYDFTKVYGTRDLGAASLSKLGKSFRNEIRMRKYLQYTMVNASVVPCDQECMDRYRCGILHLDRPSYQTCLTTEVDDITTRSPIRDSRYRNQHGRKPGRRIPGRNQGRVHGRMPGRNQGRVYGRTHGRTHARTNARTRGRPHGGTYDSDSS